MRAPGLSLETPQRSKRYSTYTLTATNSEGADSTTIEINVTDGYLVNDTGTGGDNSTNGFCNTTAASNNDNCTIRAGIEEIVNSGGSMTLYIPDGTYFPGSALPTITQTMKIQGESETGTIIDGADAHRMFFATAGDIEFANFTVQNCHATAGGEHGSALDVGSGGPLSSLDLSHMRFLNNTNDAASGAIWADHSYPFTVTDSHFEGNVSDIGAGAVDSDNTNATFIRTSFISNSATGFGWGARCLLMEVHLSTVPLLTTLG